MSEQNASAIERVQIFDTTLRDGEQSPGRDDERRGEAGDRPPARAAGRRRHRGGLRRLVRRRLRVGLRSPRRSTQPIVLVSLRTRKPTSTRALQAVEKARIPASTSSSPPRTSISSTSCMMSRQEVVDAAGLGDRRSPRSTSTTWSSPPRTPRAAIATTSCEVFGAVIAAGASTVNVPDTTGYALPEQYGRALPPPDRQDSGRATACCWSAHCHNDLGMAVANSLAAVEGGARQVECTVNGIGERAGNASMEEVVMALAHAQGRLRSRDGHRDRADLPGQPAALPDHRPADPDQQADRRRQRLRARGRHPPGRRPQDTTIPTRS